MKMEIVISTVAFISFENLMSREAAVGLTHFSIIKYDCELIHDI